MKLNTHWQDWLHMYDVTETYQNALIDWFQQPGILTALRLAKGFGIFWIHAFKFSYKHDSKELDQICELVEYKTNIKFMDK